MLIGKIVGVHGIKGTNKIRSYAESLSLFKPGSSILVRESGGQEKSREIKWVKPHTGTALILFLAIVATAKMWFAHLWKKNSTHARHKHHTQYHPSVREREFRENH